MGDCGFGLLREQFILPMILKGFFLSDVLIFIPIPPSTTQHGGRFTSVTIGYLVPLYLQFDHWNYSTFISVRCLLSVEIGGTNQH